MQMYKCHMLCAMSTCKFSHLCLPVLQIMTTAVANVEIRMTKTKLTQMPNPTVLTQIVSLLSTI